MTKPGGNSKKCTLYKSQGRKEKNKLKKLLRVAKRQPNNTQVASRINSLKTQ